MEMYGNKGIEATNIVFHSLFQVGNEEITKEEGRKRYKAEIAKKMKEEGFSIEEIIRITGIAKEEINTIE